MTRPLFTISAVFFGLALAAVAQEGTEPAPLPPSAAHRFVLLAGKIGPKAEVRAQLQVEPGEESDRALTGTYHYLSQRKTIHLSGHLDGNEVELEETLTAYGDEVTGRFEGRWEGGDEDQPIRLTGTWTSGDGKRELPFTLEETAEAGSVALDFYFFEETYERKRGDASVHREHSLLFPQLRGSGKVAARINAAIRHLAWPRVDAEAEDEPDLDLSRPAPSLRAIEKAVRAEIPSDEELDDLEFSFFETLSFQDEFQVVLNSHGLLCLRLFHTEYTGGAHGNHWASHITFDLASGEELTLDDLLKPGARDELTKLAETALREQHDLKPGDSLSEKGPLFDNAFELNDNWFLTPEGLGFSFDPYEIGPYAAGFIEPLIPFAQMKGLPKEGSLLEGLAGKGD